MYSISLVGQFDIIYDVKGPTKCLALQRNDPLENAQKTLSEL